MYDARSRRGGLSGIDRASVRNAPCDWCEAALQIVLPIFAAMGATGFFILFAGLFFLSDLFKPFN